MRSSRRLELIWLKKLQIWEVVTPLRRRSTRKGNFLFELLSVPLQTQILEELTEMIFSLGLEVKGLTFLELNFLGEKKNFTSGL